MLPPLAARLEAVEKTLPYARAVEAVAEFRRDMRLEERLELAEVLDGVLPLVGRWSECRAIERCHCDASRVEKLRCERAASGSAGAGWTWHGQP